MFDVPSTSTYCVKWTSRQKKRYMAMALVFNLFMCLYLWPIYHGPKIAERQHLEDRHGIGSHGYEPLFDDHANNTSGYQGNSEEDNVDIKFGYHSNQHVIQGAVPDDNEALQWRDYIHQEAAPGGGKSGLRYQERPAKEEGLEDKGVEQPEYQFEQAHGKIDKNALPLEDVPEHSNNGDTDTIVKMHHHDKDTALNISKYNHTQSVSRKDREGNPLHYVQEHSFLLTPGTCEENTYLLVVVCSAAQNLNLRGAIRATWGSAQRWRHLGMRVVFMLGQPSEEHSILETTIKNESMDFGDIIQGNFVDHYSNLSVKSVAFLKWAMEFCQGTQYVMKTDDDIFINVRNLLQVLGELSNNHQDHKLVLGNIIEGAEPILDRNSKWYTPVSVFSQKTYPNYASGIAYVLSGDLIAPLFWESPKTRLFWLEDIYITGMLTKNLGATLLHNPQFGYVKRKLSPCAYRLAITGHELSAKELFKVWSDVHRSDIDCTSSDLHFNKFNSLARV